MWLDDLFTGEWKLSMAFVPIFLLCIAPTDASYEFPAYRMYQYEYSQDMSYGPTASVVAFEGRSAEAKQITRKTVVMNLVDVSFNSFRGMLQKNPGAVLILLPECLKTEDFQNVTKETMDKILNAEAALLDLPSTSIPIYFSHNTAELAKINDELNNLFEMSGPASLIHAGTSVLHQFSVTGKGPEVMKQKLKAIESKLDGVSGSPTILITSRMDAMASSFALARGANSGASGLGVSLEIARTLSLLYHDDSTRPQYSVMFALMPADSYNFLSTKNWLDVKEREENSEILKNIQLAICLDSLGSSSNGKLYAHVSKPPREGSLVHKFFSELESASKANGLDLKMVHTKINIQEETRKWQHERFSLKKIPAMTISTIFDSDSAERRSMADFPSRINKRDYLSVTRSIGAGLLNTLYQNPAITHGLEVNADAAYAWIETLSASQRSAVNITKRTTNDIQKHLETFANKVDLVNVGQGLEIYNTHEVVMSQFLVRPPIFDLYLGAVVGLWLGVVYLIVNKFSDIVAFLTPIISRPEIIKRKKLN